MYKSYYLGTSREAQDAIKAIKLTTHLRQLEAESIHIFREVAAEFRAPVLLYSVGKDSSVLLHLALKAFYPATPPFPLLHIDTTWKFREMIEFLDSCVEKHGLRLLVYTNWAALEEGITPFSNGIDVYTDAMKTQALRAALDHHKFDCAIGGARRDEEKSRAKERVFSIRSGEHRWDPKSQRPELWSLYNGDLAPGETARVFPLSNWTELDVGQYILAEQIPIVPLYFAAERPVVQRNGMMVMVNDDRLKLEADEVEQVKRIRFRTLGCYPLTGAVESDAETLEEIVEELLYSRISERSGRAIDLDEASSMERKKQEGYF